MDCPRCGYDMELLDKTCARCHGQGVAPRATEPPLADTAHIARPPEVPASFESRLSEIGTALAALIAGGFLCYLLSGIVTHHELEYVDTRSGVTNVTTFRAFDFFWWFLVAACVGAILILVNKIVSSRR